MTAITSAAPAAVQAPRPKPQQPAAPQTPAHEADAGRYGAASAALEVAVDGLRRAEEGVRLNYDSPLNARNFLPDILSSSDLILDARSILVPDEKAPDAPYGVILDRATGYANAAARTLESKDLVPHWPQSKQEVMRQVQQTRVIAEKVFRQIDPRA